MRQGYNFLLFIIFNLQSSCDFISKNQLNFTKTSSTDPIQKFKTFKDEKIKFEKNLNNEEKKSKRKLVDNYQPIEIFVDLSYINTNFQTLQNQYSFLTKEDIQEAVNDVTKTLKKLVEVKIEGNRKLTVSSDLLEQNKFSRNEYSESLTKGIQNTDLVILIRLYKEGDNMNAETFAKPKIIQPTDMKKRPEVGIVILYSDFGLRETNKKEYLKYLFLHEFTHILGFTEGYIINNLAHDTKSIIRISRENPIEKLVITSTKMLTYAKKYFNCPEIDYLELEEQIGFEGEDLKNSHWDARLLLGEYMTSDLYFGDQVISEFTLLLLEGLGFYKTNLYTGGLMRFGKNRGCEFLGFVKDPTTCDCRNDVPTGSSSIVSLTNYEFCNIYNGPTCSSGRQSTTYCIVGMGGQKDYKYNRANYYKFQNIYGRKSADYCYVSDLNSKEEETDHYVGSCKLGNKNFGTEIVYMTGKINYTNSFFDVTVGEKNGNNSYCALSSLVSDDDESDNRTLYEGRITPKCYPMFCTEKSLTIQIYEQYVVCPRKGGIIQNVINYDGYIYCPEYNLICTGTIPCNNMFDCVEKESLAKSNTYDYDYTIDTEGSRIEGVNYDTELETYTSFVKGYESYEYANSKCPLNCHQCIKNKQCIECKNETFYVGTREGDDNPITCENKAPNTTFYYYNNKSYKIGGIQERSVYFKCMDGCKKCHNGTSCDICEPTHYLYSGECKESIPHCREYITTGPSVMIVNGEVVRYTQCKKCNESENFYCLKYENGTDDLEHCHDITNMTHPNKCKRTRLNSNGTECIIMTNTSLSAKLKDISIEDLVTAHIETYYPNTQIVTHYINEENDYTIAIFINSSCTKELLKSGYYSIDNDEITKKMIETNIEEYDKDEPNERAVSVFVTYGVHNYYLTIFTLEGYETPLNETEECKNMEVKIANNFSRIINQTLGEIVLSSVQYGEFDIFNETAGEFTTLCRNVTLLCIDATLFRR